MQYEQVEAAKERLLRWSWKEIKYALEGEASVPRHLKETWDVYYFRFINEVNDFGRSGLKSLKRKRLIRDPLYDQFMMMDNFH